MLGDFFLEEKSYKLLQGQAMVSPQDDTGAHALAENRIRYWHTGNVLHRGMGENEIFNFFRADFFSAPVDQVLLAPFDEIISRWMAAHQVARPVKAVGRKRPGIILRHAIVAPQRIRAAREKFTD